MPTTALSSFLEEYLKNRPPFLAVIRAKEAYLYQKYLPLKKPILDVGCGDGFFAKVSIQKNLPSPNLGEGSGVRYQKKSELIDIGLDLPDSRMPEAKNIYSKKIIYDGLTIPLKNNSVSTIICNSVLEHVSNLDRVLSEIHRVLKPSGLFICPVMARPWEDYLTNIQVYQDWMRKKQVHLNLLTRTEWLNHFKKHKFKLVEEVGHLNKKSCRLIELLHYWSLPNLLLYKLTGSWTWHQKYFLPVTQEYMLKELSKNIDPLLSGAIFYVWQK